MISLWILAILMLLTVSLAYRARMEIRLSSTIAKRIKAQQMSMEGMDRVVRILKNDENGYDALNEEWALSRGEDTIIYNILDEERKINLNTSSRELIGAIPEMGEIASAVVDWRDEDDVALPGGAEDLYYISLNPPYHCKNKAIESMEELLALKGVTSDIIRNIKPLATVYGSGRININTASGDVLELFFSGLGAPLSLADKIIFYRQGLDGTEGTEDDNIFTSVTTVKQALLPYGLTPEEEAAIGSIAANNLIDVISTCYRVSLKAVYEGKYNSNVEAVLFKDSGKIKIIYWHQDA